MNELLALQEEHDVVLQADFNFQYAQVIFVAARTEAIHRVVASTSRPPGGENEF